MMTQLTPKSFALSIHGCRVTKDTGQYGWASDYGPGPGKKLARKTYRYIVKYTYAKGDVGYEQILNDKFLSRRAALAKFSKPKEDNKSRPIKSRQLIYFAPNRRIDSSKDRGKDRLFSKNCGSFKQAYERNSTFNNSEPSASKRSIQ